MNPTNINHFEGKSEVEPKDVGFQAALLLLPNLRTRKQ